MPGMTGANGWAQRNRAILSKGVHAEGPCSSVPVLMVKVGRVRVAVAQRAVVMRMAVRAFRHGGVLMGVVSVVVRVGVFVVQRLVLVFVRVLFGEVNEHPGDHERPAGEQPAAARALAQRERAKGANEGREGEDGAGARSAETALCEQIEPQAQPVAGSANGQQAQGGGWRR